MISSDHSDTANTWMRLEDLAQVAYESGDLDSARSLLTQASEIAGAGPSVWANLGMVSLDLGDYLGAIQAYGKADEDAIQVRVNRGLAFERVGDRDRARREYLAALELEKENLDALVNLGTLELEAGRTDRARSLLLHAAEIDPATNWQLLDLHVKTGELGQAAIAAERAIEAGESRAYLDLARIERERNNLVQSEFAYRKAIDLGIEGAADEFSELKSAGDFG